MHSKVKKTIAVALVVMMLGGIPGLVGCGDNGGGGGGDEIVVGILADFTGPAALAVQSYVFGAQDYFRYAQEQGLTSGVNIKTVTYDQRSDPARVPSGYQWLKGQGTDVLFVISPTDLSILEDRVAADKMPTVGAHCSEDNPAASYIYGWWPTQSSEGEAEMEWIISDWDYEGTGRSPKVGYQTWTLPSAQFFMSGFQVVLDANPGKVDWQGMNKAPTSTTSWAPEIQQFINCDYILCTMVGSTLASFVAEARQRGYTGKFVTGTSGFPGYFELVIDRVASPDELDGCYFVMASPFYNDDLPMVKAFLQAYAEYRPSVTYQHLVEGDTGPMGGWICGMIIVKALTNAMETLGVENLTGEAVESALASLDVTVEGFSPNNKYWFPTGYHAAIRAYLAYECLVVDDEWKVITSEWIVPPELEPYQ